MAPSLKQPCCATEDERTASQRKRAFEPGKRCGDCGSRNGSHGDGEAAEDEECTGNTDPACLRGSGQHAPIICPVPMPRSTERIESFGTWVDAVDLESKDVGTRGLLEVEIQSATALTLHLDEPCELLAHLRGVITLPCEAVVELFGPPHVGQDVLTDHPEAELQLLTRKGAEIEISTSRAAGSRLFVSH